MKKIILLPVYVCLMLLSLGFLSVSAETYNDLTYTVTDNEITINRCKHNATNVVIPSEINEISVKYIDEYAFRGCSSLVSVSIPASIEKISNYGFYDCTSLESVRIESLSAWCNIDFGRYANPLSYANKLYINNELVTELIIPKDVTTINSYAFEDCLSITSVVFPENVIEIGNSAFEGCANVSSISMSDNITTIGEYAFRGCSSISEITIPKSITSIKSEAFYNCSLLQKINIEDISAWCNISFGYEANPLRYTNGFYYDNKFVTDLVIPEGVTTIKGRVFSSCSSLLSITIPNSVTVIEGSAFSGCSSIKSITIPNSVTTIEGSAFSGCSSLEEITLPFIGAKRINSGEPSSAFGYIFGYTTYDMGSAGNSYKYNLPSSLKKVTITDSETINTDAFDSRYNSYDYIEEIIILDGTTSIGTNAFSGCNALKNITLPESLIEIGNYAFSGCKIESIALPNGVELIGDGAFYGCSSLKIINFSSKLSSISNSMFSNCSSLESITIPSNIKTIAEKAFYNCDLLKNVNIFDGVTDIQTQAFGNCDGLKNITIPSSVQIIGESAFEGCSSLEEITLPFIGSERGNSGTIDSVLGYIFGYVTSYSDKTTDDTQQNYSSGSYAYYHIPASLKKITVTDETFVGYGAFYGCTNISDIILESDVKAIGSRAFAYHYNLLNVTIKSNSPKFADSMVFYDTDFATLYGYEGSTVEEYATKNGIDFEPIKQVSNYEIDGYIKAINNTIVVSVELSDTVTDECLHIALYSEKGQLVDYIIVPSYKPFNEMNVVFKDTSNSTYAKVFLWNGFTSMQPLAEAKKIDIIR